MKFLKYAAIIPAIFLAVSIAQAKTVSVGAATKNVKIKPCDSLTINYQLKDDQYLSCDSKDADDVIITRTFDGENSKSNYFPVNFKSNDDLDIDGDNYIVDTKGAITVENNCDNDKPLTLTCVIKTAKK